MEQFFICLGVVLVVLLAAIPFVIWDIKKLNKKTEEVFAGRQELDESAFYEKYFQSQSVPFFIVEKVRKILEDELGVNLSRLSAEDDFKKNLSFFWDYDSLADVEILMRIEEEFEIKITDEEAQNYIRTIDDLVNLVWRKVQRKNEFSN